MSDVEAAAAKQRAIDEGLLMKRGDPNVSEWVRLAIKYALIHMPHGWRPE